MNIARAMRDRNAISRMYNHLESLIEGARLIYCETKEEPLPLIEGKPFEEQLEKLLELSSLKASLTRAIEEANCETRKDCTGRFLILRIATLKREIDFFQTLNSKVASFHGLKVEWDSKRFNSDTSELGAYTTNLYKKVTEMDFNKEIEKRHSEIRKREDLLMEFNATVQVNLSQEDEALLAKFLD